MTNDEIKPGDRFERVGPGGWGVSRGDIYTALRPAITVTGGWFVEGSEVIWYLGVTRHWRRLPRTDAAPAVKVGDIVRGPALLAAGMRVEWAAGTATGPMLLGPSTISFISDSVPIYGVRVLALPETPKVEAVRVDDIVAPSPRCAPGCTPKEPCRSDVCPVWNEGDVDERMRELCMAKGISADALPPARASTYQPRCAEFAGYGSWNGRAGK